MQGRSKRSKEVHRLSLPFSIPSRWFPGFQGGFGGFTVVPGVTHGVSGAFQGLSSGAPRDSWVLRMFQVDTCNFRGFQEV